VPPAAAKEKQTSGMGKSGSAAGSVYHQSAKLERCLSERATTRIENRTIPLPDIYLPLDCPPLELVTHGRSPRYNLPSGRESEDDTEEDVVVCEEPPQQQVKKQEEEEIIEESYTVLEKRCASENPNAAAAAASVDERCASSSQLEMDPRTSSLQEHDDECNVEEQRTRAAPIFHRRCASQAMEDPSSTSSLKAERDDDHRLVKERRGAAAMLHRRCASQAMEHPSFTSSLQPERDDDRLVNERRRAAAMLHRRFASQVMDPPSFTSSLKPERDDDWPDSIVGQQGIMQQAQTLFGQDDVEKPNKEPFKATMEEDPSSNVSHVEEASEMAKMESELSPRILVADQESNANEIAASVELHTSPEQSPSGESLAEHQESSNALEKFEHDVTFASEALGTPDLQSGAAANELGAANQVVNESCRGTPGGSRVCFHPTSPSLRTSETSRVSEDLYLEEDGSQANGSQNILHDCITASFKLQQEHCPESFCIERQENKDAGKVLLLLPSAAAATAQDLLDLSQSGLPNLGSESGRKSVMVMSKISMMSTDESSCSSSSCSSSCGWTSASAVSSKLPDAADDHQELGLSSEPAAAKDEKSFSTSQHVELVVPVGLVTAAAAGKVTEEQLTEAAFLSNLGYHHADKETALRCASSQELLQQPRGGSAAAASTNGRMNVFRSKSTGRHTARLAIREPGVGLASAYSDSEQDANLATVSAAENHLPLEHPQVCSSRFSKVDLNACHNVHHDRILPKQFLDVILTGSVRRHGLPKKKLIDDNHNNNIPVINYNRFSSPTENAAAAGTIVMALKSEKVETNQITALVESSAFPRAAVAAESGLASERPEAESGCHKMNADHVTGCFGPTISTASGVQLQKGTKLMNTECQQQNKTDFMNPRFGMVQAMSSNPVSKLAPLMAKPTHEGKVMLNTNDKPQSMREMLLVSPQQSIEEYRLGPSIYILGNPSFSSSHQDRLWEEQAEAYSSGGRGTPGHDQENSTAAAFLAPRPASAGSGDVLLPSSASLSVRKGASDATVVPTSADTWIEKGKSQSGRKRKAKKASKPRTPLQSLLAEEIKGKDSDTNSVNWSTSSGTNPCMKQLMLRIRGNVAPKSSSPKNQHSRSHRSSFWTSCICFSPLP